MLFVRTPMSTTLPLRARRRLSRPATFVAVAAALGALLLTGLPPTPAPASAATDDLLGWVSATSGTGSAQFARDDAVLSRGEPTLRMTVDAATTATLTKDVPAQSPDTLTLSALSQVTSAGSGARAKVVVTALAGGVPLTTASGAPLTWSTPGNTGSPTFASDIGPRLRVPDAADALRVQLTFTGPGTVWFDQQSLDVDVSIRDIGGYAAVDGPPLNASAMYHYGAWLAITQESEAARRTSVAPLLALSESDLRAQARAAGLGRTKATQHPYENQTRQLATLAAKDLAAPAGSETHALGVRESRAAAIILGELAATYTRVPFQHNGAAGEQDQSIHAAHAYALLKKVDAWEALAAETGVDVRGAVETWLRLSSLDAFNLYGDGAGNNMLPFIYRHALGMAVVVNDPVLIRLWLTSIDQLMSGRVFSSDGFWWEATVHYGQQTTNNTSLALANLNNWVDPPGYVDEILGLQLNRPNLAATRYPLFAQATKAYTALKFPNGATVAINDGGGNRTLTPASPLVPSLVTNAELTGANHYAITHGDTADATQLRLSAPTWAGGLPYSGGHQHFSELELLAWGGGAEVFPAVGYPHAGKDNYRYSQMSAPFHNVPFVWDRDHTDYSAQKSKLTRSSIVGYDPGTRNGGRVSWVEASVPGPAGNGVTTKKRLAMLVQLEGNRSYAVDLSTLQGGQVHQWFLRADELEDHTQTVSVPTTPHPGSTVQTYLAETGDTSGLADNRGLMRDPLTASGAEDLDFTWAGTGYGTTVRAFLNGQAGDEVIFSRIPTLRRTDETTATKDAFPGWHAQRLRRVAPDQITLFGAVYETTRPGQAPLVEGVDWLSNGDPGTTVAAVDGGTFTDYVYISDDNKRRFVKGVFFNGHIGIARVDKATGQVIWAYADGGARVVAKGFDLRALPVITTEAVASTSAYAGTPDTWSPETANTLTAASDLPQNGSLDGTWVTMTLADGSGFAARVERVEGRTVHVRDWLPFEVTDAGAERTFSWAAGSTVEGPVTLRFSRSSATP